MLTVFLAALTHARLLTAEGWVDMGRAEGTEELTVTFAIKQTNPVWLQERLSAVSSPRSPKYGQYLNFDEIAKFVHGRALSVYAVIDALGSVGVEREKVDFTLGRDFAVAKMPVYAAELLFQTELHHFQHTHNDRWNTIRSYHFTLPASLHGHVDFVAGISEVPHQNYFTTKSKISAVDNCVNPTLINKVYNISDYNSSSPTNSQAVASFLKQFFSPRDLSEFQKNFSLPAKPIAKVLGYNNESNPGLEAQLDVEYISAAGRNVDTWFISVPNPTASGKEDFLTWIVGQVNTTNSPWVHSVSYGDDESTVDPDYRQRIELELMKFGVSGRSVLVASGDSGVYCSGRRYIPSWPASSAYVTAVGGTTSLHKVWSGSGGGFSNVSPMPDYQKKVVETYLQSGMAPPGGYFNASGRAYPDMSAFSVSCSTLNKGRYYPVDGTSCSTPIVAGIVALLNDVRLNNGMKTLGFLNPLLYQVLNGEGFIDVTEGENSYDPSFCPGFKSVHGWDPASGWGSPNFGLLRTLVLQTL